jgi:hypothetical protein
MAVDERARHRLYERLEAVLGPEEATILMEHLPPVGWADVATKRDLDALGAVLRQSMETMEQRILATTRADLLQQTRTLLVAFLGFGLSISGLAFAAARLT